MHAKEHYERHLARFYSWLTGDFESRRKEFSDFLEAQNIHPSSSKVALDLGAAHGIQSVALAKAGYKVWAIDFNTSLLEELKQNCAGLDVIPAEQDIRLIAKYEDLSPELILCWGDTLTHLDNESDIERFIECCADILKEKGKFILSFRDYSEKRTGDARFIPVKSDDTRILTCFLEYSPTHISVTDLLYEHDGNSWQQSISTYSKFRISAEEVQELLESNNLNVTYNKTTNGLVVLVAEK